MIDLKTPLHPTIDRLIAKLEKHPEVFDPAVNPYAVRVVITGSRPDPSAFGEFPHFISFDGFYRRGIHAGTTREGGSHQ